MADGSVVIDTKLNNGGLKSGLSKISSIASTAFKGVAVAVGTVTTAFAGLVTASVNTRGEIEQQIGGIETLFKDNADKVIKNANRAYKTAGMSAIEYMQLATSFSASLLQSVAGDTDRAADIADMAMQDMSDNANKMGTSMEAITNAYQGFAKQNYTMLDNLKLGYGGTKTEMQRLLKDAQKITGVKYDISHLNDVYTAIHVIQGQLGITGTTVTEASSTLQGSLTSMKASWNNFLSGSGDLSQVVNTATDVVRNLMRIASDAIPNIINQISKSLPEILQLGGDIFQQLIQGIMNNLPQLTNTTLQIIQTLLTGLINNLPQLIQTGMQVISQLIIGIAQMLPTLIPQAVNCIITIVEGLLDNIDLLIDAGIQLILGLADGLIEALPILIEKIPVIIEKLISALIRNFPKIVKAGGELIGKLVSGIVGSFWKLLEVAPQLISNIVNGLKNGLSEIKNAGKYLVEGLWNGISGMASWVYEKIKSFANNIVANIKNALGIHSPSRVFRDEVGKYMALGLGEGFTDNITKVYKQMKTAVDFETQKLGATLSTTASVNKMLTATINVNGDVNMDSTKVGRMVAPTVTRTFRTGGVC